jgi:hypothetical protein
LRDASEPPYSREIQLEPGTGIETDRITEEGDDREELMRDIMVVIYSRAAPRVNRLRPRATSGL